MEPATAKTGKLGALETVLLENSFVRVVVVPTLGGRVWELEDRMRGRQWIWHRSDALVSVHPPGSVYDDVWAGGWEELFPNDAAGEFEGRTLPDHGEWWTTEWDVTGIESGTVARVRLVAETEVIRTRCSKEFVLHANDRRLEVRYHIRSEEQRGFHFLFKQHLAVSLNSTCRLRLPGGRVRAVDGDFSDIVKGNDWSDWPYTQDEKGALVDLQTVPPPSSKLKEFVYVKDLPESWCGIEDIEGDASLRMEFDGDQLGFVWLFLAYGGWRDAYTAVLEPCTNWPKELGEAVKGGSAAELQPGEEFETTVAVGVGPRALVVGGDET